MFAYVGLHKEDRLFGVDPRCQQGVREIANVCHHAVTGCGKREGVEIDDAEDVVVFVLLVDPIPDSPEIIAQMQVP